MRNNNTRLLGLIKQLPIDAHTTPRLLNIGCGAFVEAPALEQMLPHWTIIGLDIVPLKQKPVVQIQADGLRLPFNCEFGLILIRHPDVAKYPERWKAIFENLSPYLNGALLITTYTIDEADFVRRRVKLPRLMLYESKLSPVNLAGQDKFFAAYHCG